MLPATVDPAACTLREQALNLKKSIPMPWQVSHTIHYYVYVVASSPSATTARREAFSREAPASDTPQANRHWGVSKTWGVLFWGPSMRDPMILGPY